MLAKGELNELEPNGGVRSTSASHDGLLALLEGSGGTPKTWDDEGVFSSTDVASSLSSAAFMSLRDIERASDGDASPLEELDPAIGGSGIFKGDRGLGGGEGGSGAGGGADSVL